MQLVNLLPHGVILWGTIGQLSPSQHASQLLRDRSRLCRLIVNHLSQPTKHWHACHKLIHRIQRRVKPSQPLVIPPIQGYTLPDIRLKRVSLSLCKTPNLIHIKPSSPHQLSSLGQRLVRISSSFSIAFNLVNILLQLLSFPHSPRQPHCSLYRPIHPPSKSCQMLKEPSNRGHLQQLCIPGILQSQLTHRPQAQHIRPPLSRINIPSVLE